MISNKTHVNIPQELEEGAVIHTNLAQAIIITTDDKVRLCLTNHHHLLQGRTQWATPAGILLTLGAALGTAEFKAVLGRPPEFWEAFFSFAALATLVWLAVSVYRSVQCWGRGATVDGLVAKLKAEDIREQASAVERAGQVLTIPGAGAGTYSGLASEGDGS